ncbi:MAG: SPFH domain-containing protein [Candidatus Asgardarchaeia archaeon]
MQIPGGIGAISFIVVALFLLFVLIIALYKSRYRKFKTNVYVIHFRRGKIKQAGLGGSFILLPLIDEYVEIPTTAQKVDISAERVITIENQELIIHGFVVWRVVDPEKLFSNAEWTKIDEILKDVTESVIRTTCANMRLIDILREREKIIRAIIDELDKITSDWGIKVITVEIKDVTVVNKDLFQNLQAEMYWSEWKKAQTLQQTSMQEVGILEQEREKIVGLKEREKRLELTKRDIEITKMEAEKEKARKIIEAEAEKQAQIIEAQGKAEAEYLALAKRAEGLKRLSEAINEQVITYEIVKQLPELTQNLRNMFKEAIFIGSGEHAGDVVPNLLGVIYQTIRELTKGKGAETLKALRESLKETTKNV